MKAATIDKFGHADTIHVMDVDMPDLRPGQVLVRVCASSINPVDTSVREGRMTRNAPISPPLTLGFDLAGRVENLGEGVEEYQHGEEVFGQASVLAGGSGAFAEYATTQADLIAKMPKNVSYVEAASLALTGCSAVQALYDQMRLKPRQRILIHGGSGGIGSVAIQIAKHLGAWIIATSTGDGLDYSKSLGADECIDYRDQAFDEVISDCDCVLDTVGGDTYLRSYRVVRPGGMIVSMLEPPDPESMRKYNVTAVFLLTSVTTHSLEIVRKLIESGIVTPHLDRIYALAQIQQAFQAKEKGHVNGKVGVAVAL